LNAPRLLDLVELDDAGFRALFAGSAIKRTGRDRFVRNALISIVNSGNRTLIDAVRKHRHHPSALVRDTACQTLDRLDND
jgi:epoxyqueuosine reductase